MFSLEAVEQRTDLLREVAHSLLRETGRRWLTAILTLIIQNLVLKWVELDKQLIDSILFDPKFTYSQNIYFYSYLEALRMFFTFRARGLVVLSLCEWAWLPNAVEMESWTFTEVRGQEEKGFISLLFLAFSKYLEKLVEYILCNVIHNTPLRPPRAFVVQMGKLRLWGITVWK